MEKGCTFPLAGIEAPTGLEYDSNLFQKYSARSDNILNAQT